MIIYVGGPNFRYVDTKSVGAYAVCKVDDTDEYDTRYKVQGDFLNDADYAYNLGTFDSEEEAKLALIELMEALVSGKKMHVMKPLNKE